MAGYTGTRPNHVNKAIDPSTFTRSNNCPEIIHCNVNDTYVLTTNSGPISKYMYKGLEYSGIGIYGATADAGDLVFIYGG